MCLWFWKTSDLLAIKAPKLTPYPGPRSVVIMDNAAIHHDNEIQQIIEVQCGM